MCYTVPVFVGGGGGGGCEQMSGWMLCIVISKTLVLFALI